MNVLTIPSRFNGPAGIGNGGYVCGRIAAYVDGRATVTLRRPPPLDTPMEVERDDEGAVRVRHGRTLIGEAVPSPAGPLEIPATVSPAEADAAARGARLGPGGEVLAVAAAVWLTVPRPGLAPAAQVNKAVKASKSARAAEGAR